MYRTSSLPSWPGGDSSTSSEPAVWATAGNDDGGGNNAPAWACSAGINGTHTSMLAQGLPVSLPLQGNSTQQQAEWDARMSARECRLQSRVRGPVARLFDNKPDVL